MADINSSRSGSVKRKLADPVIPVKRTKSTAVTPVKPTSQSRVRGVANGESSTGGRHRPKPLSSTEVNQLRQIYAAAKEAELGTKGHVSGFIVSALGPGRKESPHIMMTISDEAELFKSLSQAQVELPGTLPIKKFGEGKDAVNFLKLSLSEMMKSTEGVNMLKLIGMDVGLTTSDHNLTALPVNVEFYIKGWSMNDKRTGALKSGLWLSVKSITPQVGNGRRSGKRNVVPAPAIPPPLEISDDHHLPDFNEEMYDAQSELPLASEYDLDGMDDFSGLQPIEEEDEQEH